MTCGGLRPEAAGPLDHLEDEEVAVTEADEELGVARGRVHSLEEALQGLGEGSENGRGGGRNFGGNGTFTMIYEAKWIDSRAHKVLHCRTSILMFSLGVCTVAAIAPTFSLEGIRRLYTWCS